ncbi:MAG: hypothetical protein NC937_06485 [Candidatus Omnitrophica bacterium]|nr:hypothetical protein [Candidatus Omnitrophota bacterium]
MKTFLTVFLMLGIFNFLTGEQIMWLDKLKKERPRLILNQETLNDVRNLLKSNPQAQDFYKKIKEKAEKICEESVSRYEIPDGKRLLFVSRKVLERVYFLAFVYNIEKDKKYLERLWQELNAAANFPDWNPPHFLDTAEMAHAFAIGYDWCYKDWSPEQRKTIKQALISFALNPAVNTYRGNSIYGRWHMVRTNWNQVCNGGIKWRRSHCLMKNQKYALKFLIIL